MKRFGFTLLEMMISIAILSMMMIFLYKSYAHMNRTNEIFKTKSLQAQTLSMKKKTLFLDFTLAHAKSITVQNLDKQSDIVFLQTENSLYGYISPFVAYIKKNDDLFRIESHTPFTIYPLPSDTEFFGESLGKAKTFRVYQKAPDQNSSGGEEVIVHMALQKEEEVLYKLKLLNEL